MQQHRIVIIRLGGCFSVPQEAPSIISTSVTTTSVHISWTPPFFVGAPLIGYRVSVAPDDSSGQRPEGPQGGGGGGGGRRMERVIERLVSNSAAQQMMSEVVTLLRPDTFYTVNVAALNKFGAGVPAVVSVCTLPHGVGEFS